MTRKHIEVDVPALALRRAEAAAALGLSVETFDEHVRPLLPTVRVGGVIVYATTELQKFLNTYADPPIADELHRRRT